MIINNELEAFIKQVKKEALEKDVPIMEDDTINYIKKYISENKVKRILEMRDNVTFGECFEFYETGEVMRIEKRIAGFLMTFRQYDKDGNIIKEKNELSDFDKRILAKFEIK